MIACKVLCDQNMVTMVTLSQCPPYFTTPPTRPALYSPGLPSIGILINLWLRASSQAGTGTGWPIFQEVIMVSVLGENSKSSLTNPRPNKNGEVKTTLVKHRRCLHGWWPWMCTVNSVYFFKVWLRWRTVRNGNLNNTWFVETRQCCSKPNIPSFWLSYRPESQRGTPSSKTSRLWTYPTRQLDIHSKKFRIHCLQLLNQK